VKAQNVVLLGFLAILIAAMFSFPVGWFSTVVPARRRSCSPCSSRSASSAAWWPSPRPSWSSRASSCWMVCRGDEEGRDVAAARQRDRTVRQLTNGKDVAGTLKAKVPEAMETVATLTPMMLGRVVELVSTFVLLVVLAAFLVYSPSLYERGIRAMLPRTFEADFDELWERLGQGLRGWVGRHRRSHVPDGLGHRARPPPVRDPGLGLLGLLTFFGTFVPYVGAVSSSVPGLLVGLSQSPHHFLLALGVYVGVHVIEGYVVQPYVMRRAVAANPALLLFFQALMGALFGLLGLFVATPLLTVLQIIITTLWIEGACTRRRPPTSRSRKPRSPRPRCTEQRAGGLARPASAAGRSGGRLHAEPDPVVLGAGGGTEPAREGIEHRAGHEQLLVRVAGMIFRHHWQVVPSGSSSRSERRFRKSSMVRQAETCSPGRQGTRMYSLLTVDARPAPRVNLTRRARTHATHETHAEHAEHEGEQPAAERTPREAAPARGPRARTRAARTATRSGGRSSLRIGDLLAASASPSARRSSC
jgi:hypothetical protein